MAPTELRFASMEDAELVQEGKEVTELQIGAIESAMEAETSGSKEDSMSLLEEARVESRPVTLLSTRLNSLALLQTLLPGVVASSDLSMEAITRILLSQTSSDSSSIRRSRWTDRHGSPAVLKPMQSGNFTVARSMAAVCCKIQIIAKEYANSVPRPYLVLIESEARNMHDINVVDLGHHQTAGVCQLEMAGQIGNSLLKIDNAVQGCEAEAQCSNEKRDEVILVDTCKSGGTRLMDGCDLFYEVKTHDKDHEKIQEDETNLCPHIPFTYKSTDKDWKRGKGRTFSKRMKNTKWLSGSMSEQFNANMGLVDDKQALMCEQNLHMKNRKAASSIDENQDAQKPLPKFEMFTAEKEEGSGGYGIVYRAIRKADGVTFAIKCPHVGANIKYVQNELKMLERFGGRNFVIKLEGSFESENGDCLILEHVDHDRPEILKKKITITQLQWYGYCLFRALSSLHRKGVVHRDVKPGNFLYSRKANQGYLIDFNLALEMNKKCSTTSVSDNIKPSTSNFSKQGAKSTQAGKGRKLSNPKHLEGKLSKSILPPGSLKKKVEKALKDASNRSISRSQGGVDGSGITSAMETRSGRIQSEERLREPIPSKGRKELLSFVQEALRCGNHDSATTSALPLKRKRVEASPRQANCGFFYSTPMPLLANGIAVAGAGSLKTDRKYKQGPSAGTKGYKAPEVLLRSLYQGTKVDIWSAGVTLLCLMIGRTPFAGNSEQNIKEIATFRGSEDIWEVAKLHNQETLFPKDLLDVKYLSPMKLEDWCTENTRRPDLMKSMPRSLFDLVDKCLTVNPRRRISAEEALRHEFFAPCHKALRRTRSPPSL